MIEVISRSAEISPCRQYRYLLTRTLARPRYIIGGRGSCTFVMLNPSTADGLEDDPTIRRCLGFVDDLGFDELRVVNLFAWRATYPKDMLKVMDPVGPHGDDWIMRATSDANMVICAWGAHTHRKVKARAASVRKMLNDSGHDLHHLGLSAEGQPRHPLFLERSARPKRWE